MKYQSVKSGHCGVAIFWKKSMGHSIRTIECPSDIISELESAEVHGRSLFIIGVYLPQQNCKITSFSQHLNILLKLVEQRNVEGGVCIIGDMNCHFSEKLGKKTASGVEKAEQKKFQSIIRIV